MRLNWFHPVQVLKVGDRWQLTVRLKRPHGFFNPGGFDFEKWIFQNNLQATGYVTSSSLNKLLNSYWYLKPIDRLREYISSKISSSLTDHPYTGLIKALVIGVNNEITQAQWQVFRATGTSHLMAISGLHIGLVAGFLFFIIDFVWRHFANLALYYPARLVGSIAGLMGALIYSALAGFGVPTQRAVIMIAVFMCCSVSRKNLPTWNALLLALFIVNLIDPFSIMSVSFWLSFGAVATIIYGLSYRVSPKGLWWKWGRTQWVVTVGLIPLTLFLFQQASLISIIANIIAIPLVGTCVVPLCLVGSLLLVLPIHLGDYLLQLAGILLKIVWPMLTFFASLPHNTLQIPIPNQYLFLLALAGVFLLLAPRGFPQRWLGIILLLPLCLYRYAVPPHGKVWFTLLDVGQGLSAVIQTKQHVLIFDTGPKFSPEFDTGSAVILPFLQINGIKKIDMLVVSHADNDHIGGSQSLINTLTTQRIISSVPEKFSSQTAFFCEAGQHWQWDGVDFDVLSPAPELLGLDNNSSCVLRVSTGNFHLLLTGDIEKLGENYLVTHQLEKLKANIIIAPHHGSRTSSTTAFLRAVDPEIILIPVGYLNRYRLPSQLIIERYQNMHAQIYDSIVGGAIMLCFGSEGLVSPVQQYRQLGRHFWNAKSIVKGR